MNSTCAIGAIPELTAELDGQARRGELERAGGCGGHELANALELRRGNHGIVAANRPGLAHRLDMRFGDQEAEDQLVIGDGAVTPADVGDTWLRRPRPAKILGARRAV